MLLVIQLLCSISTNHGAWCVSSACFANTYTTTFYTYSKQVFHSKTVCWPEWCCAYWPLDFLLACLFASQPHVGLPIDLPFGQSITYWPASRPACWPGDNTLDLPTGSH